jgi:hypothetical protein
MQVCAMSRQTTLSAFSLIALLASQSLADYRAPRFFEMVGGADLIVLGQVESVQEETYRLKIERVLAGKWEAPDVTVMKVRDWACSWRFGPYEIGQRVVAFLEKRNEWSKHFGMTVFSQMSAGCEGEFPVQDSTVYCYTIPGTPASRGSIGRHQDVYKARLDYLLSAIGGYRSLYRVTLSKQVPNDHLMFAERVELSPETLRLSAAAHLSQLKSYARRSYLHQYLVESTEAAIGQLSGKPSMTRSPVISQARKADSSPVIVRYPAAKEADNSP